MRKQRIIGSVAAVAMLAAGMSGSVLVGGVYAADEIEVTVLSGRPDTVSGGDALLQIAVPADVALSDVRVAVNAADATAGFRADVGGHRLVGIVDGLSHGANEVSVSVAGDASDAPAWSSSIIRSRARSSPDRTSSRSSARPTRSSCRRASLSVRRWTTTARSRAASTTPTARTTGP